MSGMDRLTDDSGYEAFAAYFRKNYPGPDTIIGNPDWHAPRLYRAALDARRRASQAAPAPSDGLREAVQATMQVALQLPEPTIGKRQLLAKIAALRADLSASPAQEGGE